jgi:hypothetical protein
MFKDTTGFLWLWSEGSLARFDGYQFKVFGHNPDDSTSLPLQSIIEARQLANGDIYIFFGNDSRVYNPQKLSFTSQFPYKRDGLIRSGVIFEGENNAVYSNSGNNFVKWSNGVTSYIPLPAGVEARTSYDAEYNIRLNTTGKVFILKVNANRFDPINIYDRSGKPDTTCV